MEVKVNIKANKMTDEQQRVLADALTDYVAEEGDMNIARDLAVRIKKGMVMLFEYEPQLTPLKDFAPKQEWSEEDEKKLNYLIALLHNSTMTNAALSATNEGIEDWFKSLKERVGCEVNCTTKWKPSGEQMKILLKYAEQNNYDGSILSSLYNDLKKLKGQSTK